jgi:hypothetical protein
MRAENVNPMQQVFTICIGDSTYQDAVGEDADYMMGVAAWDPTLQSTDPVFEMTPSEFAEQYAAFSNVQANYQAAAAAGALSVLVQGVERANSTESDDVREALREGGFHTVCVRERAKALLRPAMRASEGAAARASEGAPCATTQRYCSALLLGATPPLPLPRHRRCSCYAAAAAPATPRRHRSCHAA